MNRTRKIAGAALGSGFSVWFDLVMQRLRKLIPAIVTFAVGCALGALAYFYLSMWSFALPPIVSLLALFAIPRD